MLGQNDRAIAKQRHGADGVTQLAKISEPFVMKQFLHCFGMDRSDVFPFFQSGRF